MVNITASLMTLLAVASLAAAAPASFEPQSNLPANPLEKRVADCRDDNFGIWKRGKVHKTHAGNASLLQPLTWMTHSLQMQQDASTNSPHWATKHVQEAARGAGLIMDKCSRGDGTVMGQNNAWASRCLSIMILGK
ncbi:hypothetical protein E4T43_08868 [Aureobasidium subglaciale]|nr:hypothetical protein E4T43_08868 [Aureobasidium subglaciale]